MYSIVENVIMLGPLFPLYNFKCEILFVIRTNAEKKKENIMHIRWLCPKHIAIIFRLFVFFYMHAFRLNKFIYFDSYFSFVLSSKMHKNSFES